MAGISNISHIRHSPIATSRSPGRRLSAKFPRSVISVKNGVSDKSLDFNGFEKSRF